MIWLPLGPHGGPPLCRRIGQRDSVQAPRGHDDLSGITHRCEQLAYGGEGAADLACKTCTFRGGCRHGARQRPDTGRILARPLRLAGGGRGQPRAPHDRILSPSSAHEGSRPVRCVEASQDSSTSARFRDAIHLGGDHVMREGSMDRVWGRRSRHGCSRTALFGSRRIASYGSHVFDTCPTLRMSLYDDTHPLSSCLATFHVLEPATMPLHRLRPNQRSGAYLDEFVA